MIVKSYSFVIGLLLILFVNGGCSFKNPPADAAKKFWQFSLEKNCWGVGNTSTDFIGYRRDADGRLNPTRVISLRTLKSPTGQADCTKADEIADNRITFVKVLNTKVDEELRTATVTISTADKNNQAGTYKVSLAKDIKDNLWRVNSYERATGEKAE